MTLAGPVALLIGSPAVDYGDDVTNAQQSSPAPVVLAAINRDYSQTPTRGYGVQVTGVSKDFTVGTLWRYLWDNFNEEDVPITWSPLGEGDVYFGGVISSIPNPNVSAQANQHGTFDITLPLVARPTIVPNPATPEEPEEE